MTNAKSAWHETGERFGNLSTKLKAHYEQQRDQEADQSRTEVRDALHQLTRALEDAFETIGSAAGDDSIKNDVKQVGHSLVTALGATFSEVSAELQRTFTSKSPGSQHTGAESRTSSDNDTDETDDTDDTEPGQGRKNTPRVEPWGTP